MDRSLIGFSVSISCFHAETSVSENSAWNFGAYDRGYETQQ